MSELLFHIYHYAEAYTVVLVWVIVPFGIFAAHLLLSGPLKDVFIHDLDSSMEKPVQASPRQESVSGHEEVSSEQALDNKGSEGKTKKNDPEDLLEMLGADLSELFTEEDKESKPQEGVDNGSN